MPLYNKKCLLYRGIVLSCTKKVLTQNNYSMGFNLFKGKYISCDFVLLIF